MQVLGKQHLVQGRSWLFWLFWRFRSALPLAVNEGKAQHDESKTQQSQLRPSGKPGTCPHHGRQPDPEDHQLLDRHVGTRP